MKNRETEEVTQSFYVKHAHQENDRCESDPSRDLIIAGKETFF
jgi:hypothetical protein